MSNTRTLASKLYELMTNYNPYEVWDTEYSEELALKDITENPLIVIDNLIDMVNEYMDERR